MTDDQEFVTISELARILGVSRTGIRTVLWRHHVDFPRPLYRRADSHPRLVRVLGPKEVRLIRVLMGFP